MHPKIAAAVSAGTITTALVGVLALVGITVPDTVSAALVTVLSFAAGYIKSS